MSPLQQDVSVVIDQARQHGVSAQVNQLGAGRGVGHRGKWPDSGDPVSLHQDSLVDPDVVRITVNEPARPDQGPLGRRRSLSAERPRHDRQHGDRKHPTGYHTHEASTAEVV